MDTTDEQVVILASTVVLLSCAVKKIKRRRIREVWVKGWIGERVNHGAYNSLLVDRTFLNDKYDYRDFMRMDCQTFHTLLEKIRPYITKKTILSFDRLKCFIYYLLYTRTK